MLHAQKLFVKNAAWNPSLFLKTRTRTTDPGSRTQVMLTQAQTIRRYIWSQLVRKNLRQASFPAAQSSQCVSLSCHISLSGEFSTSFPYFLFRKGNSACSFKWDLSWAFFFCFQYWLSSSIWFRFVAVAGSKTLTREGLVSVVFFVTVFTFIKISGAGYSLFHLQLGVPVYVPKWKTCLLRTQDKPAIFFSSYFSKI